MNADELTRKHTAFSSFFDLIKAINYTPSLNTKKSRELAALANFYDAAQRDLRDPRRVLRY